MTCAKGISDPSWAVTSFTESSVAGEISCFVLPDFSYDKQQM